MAYSSLPRWEYDVFLSFRGCDTRRTFISHLYMALCQKGFKTFKDDEKLERGKYISSDLVKNINLSSIALIIFSKNYANSSWCLDEVVEINECRRTKGQIVLPIFYNVEAHEVRNQVMSFAKAFSRHEETYKEDMERVQRWRVALKEAANTGGLDLEDAANGDESEFIQQILEGISKQLKLSCPSHMTPVFPTSSTPLRSGKLPMASSSLPRWEYDVLLSFSFEVRKTFASHLHTALDQRGFRTFKDDKQGNSVSLNLVRNINLTSIAVIVFSNEYANSSWCLDELLEIIECRRTKGQIVLPIFYNVTASDVRKQKGSFTDAFYRHEERKMERVERWRVALKEVASLSGLDLDTTNGDEAEFIQQILQVISRELQLSSPSHMAPVVPTSSTDPLGSSMFHSDQNPIKLKTIHTPQSIPPYKLTQCPKEHDLDPMSADLPCHNQGTTEPNIKQTTSSAIADMQPIPPSAEKSLPVTLLSNGMEGYLKNSIADLIKEIVWLKENLEKAREKNVGLQQTVSELRARDDITMTSTDEASDEASGGHIPPGKRALHSNSNVEAKTWASIAKQPPIPKMQFEFHKPTSVENGPLVEPPKEVSEEGMEYWKAYMVGYFLHEKMPYSVVQPAAMRIWKDKGVADVLVDGKGFFYFKFDNLTATEAILSSGPWNIAGKQIMLMKWNPDLSYEKEQSSLVPVWVKFYDIPLQFWTGKGLSYIASAIGKPLHADEATESMKNLIFARICIEVDVSSPLLDKFMLKTGENTQVEIWVEYEWVPKYCSLCSKIGHSTSSCQALRKRKWKSNEDIISSQNPKQELS